MENKKVDKRAYITDDEIIALEFIEKKLDEMSECRRKEKARMYIRMGRYHGAR